MTQEERKRRSREEIYQVALEEFGTNGYEKVTMERICTGHGISKGMMYHYYANKDQLFLLCVERTYGDLKDYLERESAQLSRKNPVEAIKGFFQLREGFFQRNPLQQGIFEAAAFRPPNHLLEQIRQLQAPVRALNIQFLQGLMERCQLRPGLEQEQVARYLEVAEAIFRHSWQSCGQGAGQPDLHRAMERAGELTDFILFGVLRQPAEETALAPAPEKITEDKEC